ncbi:hypothetical protein D3C87_1934400 [compost metagenome]
MDGIDPHLHRQRIEIGVARLLDGAVHIYAAQAALMAAECAAAKAVVTRVADHHAGRARAQLQRGHGHERLVSGARRIGAAQGTVEQRLVDGLVESGPAF